MKKETFEKRFGKEHPALTIKGFIGGLFKAKNGKMYNVINTTKGLVAKKVKL